MLLCAIADFFFRIVLAGPASVYRCARLKPHL